MSNIFSLIHKTVFITGGGSGIGKQIAKTFVNNGAHVLLCGRRLDKLKEAKSEIEEQYNHFDSKPSSNVISQNNLVNIVQLDITDFKNLESNIRKITEQFKIDVLVNNAGITNKHKKSSWEFEQSEWDDVMNTNLKSVWLLSNLVGKHMIDNQIKGSIINIASTVAERSIRKNAIYCMSKSAVVGLTQKMAVDYAQYGIRVNAISPGYLKTDMIKHFMLSEVGQNFPKNHIPLERYGEPEDLEGAALLLASDASKYMTGSNIHIDGGLVANRIL